MNDCTPNLGALPEPRYFLSSRYGYEADQMSAYALAEIAADRASRAQSEWKSMDLAPKDGTTVYLHVGGCVYEGSWLDIPFAESRDADGHYLGQQDAEAYWMDHESGDALEPTEWMPKNLPNPPATLGDEMSSAFNIPAGWKLVPLEPTFEMNKAGQEAVFDFHPEDTIEGNEEAARAAYLAMIDAAPPSDAVPGEPVAMSDAEFRARVLEIHDSMFPHIGLGAEDLYDKVAVFARRAITDLATPTASRAAGSEPVWFAVDTPGAEFDVSFALTMEEALQLNEGDPDAASYITPLYDHASIAPAAAAEPSEDPYFGVQDEVYLTRAVCVMNDVLTDISGWEYRELAEAVESSKVDLCAMIECIRMRADGNYVPGSKPIDGEAVPTIAVRAGVASLVAADHPFRVALQNIASNKPRFEAASKLDGSGERLRCAHCGYAWQPDSKPFHALDCAYMDAVNALVIDRASAGEAQSLARAEPWLKSSEVQERLKGAE